MACVYCGRYSHAVPNTKFVDVNTTTHEDEYVSRMRFNNNVVTQFKQSKQSKQSNEPVCVVCLEECKTFVVCCQACLCYGCFKNWTVNSKKNSCPHCRSSFE